MFTSSGTLKGITKATKKVGSFACANAGKLNAWETAKAWAQAVVSSVSGLVVMVGLIYCIYFNISS